MTAPALGHGQAELILRLGSQRRGVTAPQIADRFDISHLAAWRAIQRLVKRGRLFETDHKRRRSFVFERAGRGATVYKTKQENHDGHEAS